MEGLPRLTPERKTFAALGVSIDSELHGSSDPSQRVIFRNREKHKLAR